MGKRERLNAAYRNVRYNANPGFVREYFDTDKYKKTVYKNPRLVKTGRYTLTYRCDHFRRLVIPKLYAGIKYSTKERAEVSVARRVRNRCILVILAALLFGSMKRFADYRLYQSLYEDRKQTVERLEEELRPYGYAYGREEWTIEILELAKDKYEWGEKIFRRETGDGTSYITIQMDGRGEIDRISAKLSYSGESAMVEEELAYLFHAVDTGFDREQTEECLSRIRKYREGREDEERQKLVTIYDRGSKNSTLRVEKREELGLWVNFIYARNGKK